MNDAILTVIRGKLTSLETGFLVGMYEADELKSEAEDLLTAHPDMPADERQRAEALKLAVAPTRGKTL